MGCALPGSIPPVPSSGTGSACEADGGVLASAETSSDVPVGSDRPAGPDAASASYCGVSWSDRSGVPLTSCSDMLPPRPPHRETRLLPHHAIAP